MLRNGSFSLYLGGAVNTPTSLLIWTANNPKSLAISQIENCWKPVRLSAIDEDMLSLLLGRELYGLEILDQLNLDRPTNILRFGSLYPALGRLEKKGLVSWRWGDKVDEFGGARRKYYKVTGLGASSLEAVRR